MDWALSHYVLLGVTTNIPFLRDVVTHEVFRRGEATTGFVDEYFTGWQPRPRPERSSAIGPVSSEIPDLVLVAAALSEILEGAAVATTPLAVGGASQGDPFNPWRQLTGFRTGAS
jgi:hypothetical protein